MRILLFDCNLNDVGKMLIEKGLARGKRVAQPMEMEQDYLIPG